jgi:hypothetical protein
MTDEETAPEPDPGLPWTANMLEATGFSRRRGGYEPSGVETFKARAIKRVRDLETENALLVERLAAASEALWSDDAAGATPPVLAISAIADAQVQAEAELARARAKIRREREAVYSVPEPIWTGDPVKDFEADVQFLAEALPVADGEVQRLSAALTEAEGRAEALRARRSERRAQARVQRQEIERWTAVLPLAGYLEDVIEVEEAT